MMDRENRQARQEAGEREGHRPDHPELGKTDLEQVTGGNQQNTGRKKCAIWHCQEPASHGDLCAKHYYREAFPM